MTPALLPLVTGAEVTFWIAAPIMVACALGVVLFRKAVHSAVSMAGMMVTLAVLYASLDAPFLFAVQIIVYTGAILMLFLFVMMLVGVDSSDSIVETLKGQRPLAIMGAAGVAGLLIFGVGGALHTSRGYSAEVSATNVETVADMIFGRYVFVFELCSALLITAALGAMVLAHPERLRKKPGQKEAAAKRMAAYRDAGEHPGPLPNPGVFARHNSIAVPALLPDGSVSEKSVSPTLADRGVIANPDELGDPTIRTFKAIGQAREDEE